MTVQPWMFPVPLRPSRFEASSNRWRQCNVEVALDLIGAFAFTKQKSGPVLWCDYQTQIDDNARGRLGSGRGGVYRNKYIKGVGRTLTAANWNDSADVYHASGHMSVGSALRELLITKFVRAHGVADAIVPCETILAGRLEDAEMRAASEGHTSSRPKLTPADALMMALSVKPADFVRTSNFVWALNQMSSKVRDVGLLFMEFERGLHPPEDRGNLEGEPESIAAAMDAAFQRGLANFRRFARIGLFWMYPQNNFTLDGRFLDLETPLVFGAPFIGAFTQTVKGGRPRRVLGFEEFAFVLHWRLFVRWLDMRLQFLTSPGVLADEIAREFLKAVRIAVGSQFHKKHLLYADGRLISEAVGHLVEPLDLGRSGRSRLMELAKYEFAVTVRGAVEPVPDAGWKRVRLPLTPPTSTPFRVEAPDFITPVLTSKAEVYGVALAKLGACGSPAELLRGIIRV